MHIKSNGRKSYKNRIDSMGVSFALFCILTITKIERTFASPMITEYSYYFNKNQNFFKNGIVIGFKVKYNDFSETYQLIKSFQ
jgi:hypothetical protein